MKTKTLMVALATLLIGSFCFWACQKDEPISGKTDSTEHIQLKTGHDEPDCNTHCINPDEEVYFEKTDQQIISWGGRHNDQFSKTVDIVYYNTLDAFILNVKSSENIANLLVDGISVKEFSIPLPADTWYELSFPLAYGWEVCDDFNFQFSVIGNGPPAVFDVEYQLIGECIEPSTSVTFIYNGEEVTYGVVESAGRYWLDRNLGASRVAISSTDTDAYGDLFQWGRLDDGHQDRNSPTTTTLSSSDVPGHGDFIVGMGSPFDWRSPQNDNLWQGVSGPNNSCPPGWRIPTEAEWHAELQSWISNNSDGAFASPLKLPVAGYRSSGGSLNLVGSAGYYWSSTVDDSYSRSLNFSSSNAHMFSGYRARGFSVRCLKDDTSD